MNACEQNKSNTLSFKNIRPKMLIYVIAYALELILYCAKGHFIGIETKLFGISAKMITYIFHAISSVIIMLLWNDKFKKLIYISIITTVIGFLFMMFLEEGYLKLVFGIVGMAGLGGCVTACRCGYAFASNNSEKVFGMFMMILLVSFVHLLSWFDIYNVFTLYILPIILLFLLSLCLILFKENDFIVKEESNNYDKKALVWAFVYFVCYFAIDGFIWKLVNINPEYKTSFTFIGLIIASFLFLLLIGIFKINIYHVWCLFFIFTILGSFLTLLNIYYNTDKLLHLFNGLAIIGWPLCIYTLACIQKKYSSYKLLKICTLIFAIISPLTTLLDEIVDMVIPEHMALFALIYIFTICITLLLLSPISYKYLFSDKICKEFSQDDINVLLEKRDEIFDEFNLTERQEEIALLLLQGKSRVEIAKIIFVSESTVKKHIAELYKKLEIKNRYEFFAKFQDKLEVLDK